jgi:hypothetical protein
MQRWEQGTANMEAIAGVGAAINYIASLGTRFGNGEPGFIQLMIRLWAKGCRYTDHSAHSEQ